MATAVASIASVASDPTTTAKTARPRPWVPVAELTRSAHRPSHSATGPSTQIASANKATYPPAIDCQERPVGTSQCTGSVGLAPTPGAPEWCTATPTGATGATCCVHDVPSKYRTVSSIRGSLYQPAGALF